MSNERKKLSKTVWKLVLLLLTCIMAVSFSACDTEIEKALKFLGLEETYTVIFTDYDDTVLSFKEDYYYGDEIIKPQDPERDSDNTYTYSFRGWDKTVSETVTEDVTYKAVYDKTYIDYSVVFKDYDGAVILEKNDYHYGDEVTIPKSPKRNATENVWYSFKSWDKTVGAICEGNAVYSAIYTEHEGNVSDLTIHFLELGVYNTGDCTLIKLGDTEILIDAGAKTKSIDTVDNYIKGYCTDGILEYVVVTHAHEDHYACFTTDDSLFNRYEVGTIIDFAQTNQSATAKMYNAYKRELGEAIEAGAKHYTAKECRENDNYIFEIADGVTFTVLDSYYYYNKDSSGENNHSVCTLLTQGDKNYLFTGDLEKKGEEKLVSMNNLPEVELYKAGHHGSKTSSNDCLLSVIKPKTVCVCCCAGNTEYTKEAKNTFPTQDFIDRISLYTAEVYVTTLVLDDGNKTFQSMNGNIVITCNANGITINCSNNNVLLKDTEWFIKNRVCPDAWEEKEKE